MTVIAYHLIWTNYGTWFGQRSAREVVRENVYTPVLAELGEVHFGRKKLQPSRQRSARVLCRSRAVLQFPVFAIRCTAAEHNRRMHSPKSFADINTRAMHARSCRITCTW